MVTKTRVSGNWKLCSDIWVKVSGSWKRCEAVWTKVSGTWKRVHEYIALTNKTVTHLDTVEATAGVKAKNNGDFQTNIGGVYSSVSNEWLYSTRAGAGADEDYYIRAELDSGTTPSGDNVNVTMSLSVDREWYLVRNSSEGVGITSCSLTIRLYQDSPGGTLNELESATVDLTARIIP